MTPADMARLHAAGFARDRPWSAAEITALLRSGSVFSECVEHGFALVQVLPPEAEILTIVVAPDAQGRGIGAALLRAAMARAAARGADRLLLEVDAENHPARRLYDRAGFRQDGLRKAYYRHGDGRRSDALLLSCALGA